MKIACLQFNPIQENTYVVWDDTKACIVIDAGNSNPREDAALDNFIAEHGLKPVMKIGVMPAADLDLDTLSEVRFGNTALRVIRTPGHTPGHVALYEPDSKSLFTGDTLFRESIGRTDLPGGDYSWIMRSILDSLIPLGEEVHIYPGHGPESTIGHETLYNPFIVEVLNEEINYRN